MATIFRNSDLTGTTPNTPTLNIAAGDRLILGPEAQIANTADGVQPTVRIGGNNHLVIDGQIYGNARDAVLQGGVGAVRVVVGDTGRIAGADSGTAAGLDLLGNAAVENAGEISGGYAIYAFGGGLDVINHGTIAGLARGIYASDGPASTVVNFGDITAQTDAAVILNALDDGSLVTNYGRIASGAFGVALSGGAATLYNYGDIVTTGSQPGAVLGDAGAQTVANAGRILGGLRLGDGNDVYDGRGGTLAGEGQLEGGSDTAFGGAGADWLNGGSGHDEIEAGDGNDTVVGGSGADLLDGGGGDLDWLSYAGDTAGVTVDLGTGDAAGGHAEGDVFTGFEGLSGGTGNDSLTGSAGANRLRGGNGNDVLAGGAGNDRLLGDGGADTLLGGAGLDILVGGTGADRFRFTLAADSGPLPAQRDRLRDFVRAEGDRIDLADIDANAVAGGNQAFSFIGAAAFGNVAGQLRARQFAATTLVEGDTNGDGTADLAITLVGAIALVAGDFVL